MCDPDETPVHLTTIHRGYTKRILGYQINYGSTLEWNYWDTEKSRPDWNPQAVTAWKTFVDKKYQTIEKLNTACRTALSGFSEVLPPDGIFRHPYHAGYLRDPVMDVRKRDYAAFANESIAALIQSVSILIQI